MLKSVQWSYTLLNDCAVGLLVGIDSRLSVYHIRNYAFEKYSDRIFLAWGLYDNHMTIKLYTDCLAYMLLLLISTNHNSIGMFYWNHRKCTCKSY